MSQPAQPIGVIGLPKLSALLAERPAQIDLRVARLVKNQSSGAGPSRTRAIASSAAASTSAVGDGWSLFLLLVGLLAERQRLQLCRRSTPTRSLRSKARAALLVQQPGQDGAALALAILSTAPALRNGGLFRRRPKKG